MIVVEQQVHADQDRLWGLVGRVSAWAELLPTIDHVESLSGGQPPAVGSRYAIRQPGLPRLIYEVTEWVPGQRFTWVATAPGVRTTATHAISPTAEGSLLELTLHWSGPLKPLVELLYARRAKRYVQLEGHSFKQLAERPEG